MTSFINIFLTNVSNTIQNTFQSINSNYEKMYPTLHFYFLQPKLQIRESIVNNSKKVFHFKLLISSVPVLVSISQVIYLKYQNQTFSYFFKKNLPGISPEHAKISWQTFEQVFSDQLKLDSFLATSHLSTKTEIVKNTNFNINHKFIKEPILQIGSPISSSVTPSQNQSKKIQDSFTLLSDLYIKRVDFYSDSILIKPNSNWNAKKNQFFVGVFPNSNYSTHFSTGLQVHNKLQIGNNWYTIPAKKRFMSFTSIKNASFLHSFKNNQNPSHTKVCETMLRIPFYHFYLHLDELPVKLQETSTNKIEQSENGIAGNKKIQQIKQNFGTQQKLDQDGFSKKAIQNSFSTVNDFSFSRWEKILIDSKINDKANLSKSSFHFISRKIHKISSSSLCFPPKNSIYFFKGMQSITAHVLVCEGVKNSNFDNASLSKESFLPKETNKIENHQKNTIFTNSSIKLSHKQETNFLQDEIKKNFYEKNLSPILYFSRLHIKILNALEEKEILSWIADDTNSMKLLEFISELEISTLEKSAELIKPEHFIFLQTDLISPRFMSGYTFPDMNNGSNLSELIQFFYKKNSGLFSVLFPLRDPLRCTATEATANWQEKKYNPTLQIDLSKNFSYSFEFLNLKLNAPKLPLPFQSDTTYRNVQNPKKIVYQGPAVFPDPITNELSITSSEKGIKQTTLDEIHTPSYLQFRQWVTQFLDADNPLSDRRETFFGKNVFDELTNLQKSWLDSLLCSADLPCKGAKQHELDFLIKVPLFQISFEAPLVSNELIIAELNYEETRDKKLVRDEVLHSSMIIPSDIQSYIVYLHESEWETFSRKITREKEEDSFPILPSINIYSPKKGFIEWPLNQLDYQGADNFISNKQITDFQLKKNQASIDKKEFFPIVRSDLSPLTKTRTNSVIPHYHYLPYSQTLRKHLLPKKYFFGKLVKKKFSIYKNIEKIKLDTTSQFSRLFLEIFEPISNDSWLFVTQFSIGLFLFQILQIILGKYEKELEDVFSHLVENQPEHSTSLEAGLDEEFQVKLVKQEENFRIMKTVKKRFHDIAGIDTILPELGEIVWFLRNSGRSFTIGNAISKGILLTGPPGTGKTLLVQAIAGEAEVPVLIESGSSLKQPFTSETSAERLQHIFQKAREMSPCILFIDEIDTLGEGRNEILGNPITTNEIINSIYPSIKNTNQNLVNSDNLPLVPQSRIVREDETSASSQSEFLSDVQTDNGRGSSGHLFNHIKQKQQNQNFSKQQKSHLLLQLLVELDGMANQKKIVVIGATNRPQILDAALTRPGRFDKVLELQLPGKQKRIEILKLYSKNLGVDKTIYWNYLANLTIGLSAADLASVMNQSSMKAIESETIHTIETIESGINSILGYTSYSPSSSNFFSTQKTTQSLTQKANQKKQLTVDTGVVFGVRLAYYQAGKAIIHTLLKHHPPVILLHLWPQLKKPRYHLVNSIVEKEFSQIHTRIELESRIIGFYAGKAGEILGLFHAENNFSLQKSSNKKYKQVNTAHSFLSFWQSDLGIEDINFASWVAQLMITKWYFYSRKISTQKLNQLSDNSNLEKISDFGVFEFFKQLAFEMETEANYQTTFGFENSQNWITTPWLQTQIIKKLEFSYLRSNHWYKIYVDDHEDNENTQCLPPDEYYHNNVSLNNLVQNKLELDKIKLPTFAKIDQSLGQDDFVSQTQFKDFSNSLTWNNVLESNRDYIYHGLILNCFNKAISILDDNRELLDYFASYLVQKEVIREHEITEIISKFSFQSTKQNSEETTPISKQQNFLLKNSSKIVYSDQARKIIEKPWGKYSRKKLCRFINFQTIFKPKLDKVD